MHPASHTLSCFENRHGGALRVKVSAWLPFGACAGLSSRPPSFRTMIPERPPSGRVQSLFFILEGGGMRHLVPASCRKSAPSSGPFPEIGPTIEILPHVCRPAQEDVSPLALDGFSSYSVGAGPPAVVHFPSTYPLRSARFPLEVFRSEMLPRPRFLSSFPCPPFGAITPRVKCFWSRVFFLSRKFPRPRCSKARGPASALP